MVAKLVKHKLNTVKTDPTLVASFPSDHYKNLNMAVLFSTARDKKSDFVDDIIEEDEDKQKKLIQNILLLK